jgi:hypothetical protein
MHYTLYDQASGNPIAAISCPESLIEEQAAAYGEGVSWIEGQADLLRQIVVDGQIVDRPNLEDRPSEYHGWDPMTGCWVDARTADRRQQDEAMQRAIAFDGIDAKALRAMREIALGIDVQANTERLQALNDRAANLRRPTPTGSAT